MLRTLGLSILLAGMTSAAVAQQAPGNASAGMCQAAAAQGCTCYEPSATFQSRGAQLTVVSDEVLVMRNSGAPQPAAGFNSALVIGDRVLTGEAGSATVAFPNGCQINLTNQSLVTITQVEDCACAAPVEAESSFGAQSNERRNNLPLNAFLASTVVVVGGPAFGLAVAENNRARCRDNAPPVSPPFC